MGFASTASGLACVDVWMASGLARVDGRTPSVRQQLYCYRERRFGCPRICISDGGRRAISTQVHARAPDGVARGGRLHALVQVLL